jgi:hypothetical protein
VGTTGTARVDPPVLGRLGVEASVEGPAWDDPSTCTDTADTVVTPRACFGIWSRASPSSRLRSDSESVRAIGKLGWTDRTSRPGMAGPGVNHHRSASSFTFPCSGAVPADPSPAEASPSPSRGRCVSIPTPTSTFTPMSVSFVLSLLQRRLVSGTDTSPSTGRNVPNTPPERTTARRYTDRTTSRGIQRR